MTGRSGRVAAVVTVLVALVAAGCKKKVPSEEERLEELTGGLRMAAYSTLSGNLIPKLVKGHNKRAARRAAAKAGVASGTAGKAPGAAGKAPGASGKAPGTAAGTAGKAPKVVKAKRAPLRPATVHVLLGLAWALAQKPALAILEGDLVIEDDDFTPIEKALGHAVRSMGLMEAGLPQLARAASKKARAGFGKTPKGTRRALAVGYALIGMLCIKDKDWRSAAFFFNGFGSVTSILWPFSIASIGADIEEKRYTRALSRAQALAKDPNVPQSVRVALTAALAEVGKAIAKLDLGKLWSKAVSVALFEQLSKVRGLGKVMRIVGKARRAL